ncbi:ribonuclease Y [bacterium]|nr:ribonuclease Y [bacterium]
MTFVNNLSTLFRNQRRSTGRTPTHKSNNRQNVAPTVEKQVANAKAGAKAAVNRTKNNIQAELEAQKLINQAEMQAKAIVRDAQAQAKEMIVEAKDQALATRAKADSESQKILRQAEEQQRTLTLKIDRIDQRLSQMDQKEANLEQEKNKLIDLQTQVEETKRKVLARLEELAGMTKDEAHDYLLDQARRRATQDMAQIIRQKEEEMKAEADTKAKEILIEAMKYGATDYVAEYTMSTVNLPSEDAKGKIIGKNGRNIHAFERVTGVDVDLDSSPTEVKLSCFDPVRREIAKISLEKLIKDGRVQPTRIEEIVAKTSKELDKVMFEEGKNLCHAVGIYNLPNELMQLLGRFKYRFSYGQNLISHTLEETRIGIKIAHELGLNVNIVKLGCLLHDIGKVSEEVDGSHVELGVKIAKKYNMPQGVIDAIAQHHEDEPFTGPEQVAVFVADAISGARPGARYENYDEYVQRLQKLEKIANEHPEVAKSYAIQAGREIRVILEPKASKDDDVVVLADRIRDEIKQQLTYPGTVTVTVIRETRGQAVAK